MLLDDFFPCAELALNGISYNEVAPCAAGWGGGVWWGSDYRAGVPAGLAAVLGALWGFGVLCWGSPPPFVLSPWPEGA